MKYADSYNSDLSEMCLSVPTFLQFLPYHMLFLSRGFRLAYSASEPLSSCIVTSEEVENALGKLDIAKVIAPDAIPPLVLKYCNPALAGYLYVTDCFQKVFTQIYWRVVVPFHKSGSVWYY